jgi:hypothetical protein
MTISVDFTHIRTTIQKACSNIIRDSSKTLDSDLISFVYNVQYDHEMKRIDTRLYRCPKLFDARENENIRQQYEQ